MAGKNSPQSAYAPIAFAIMVAALVFSAAFYFSPGKSTFQYQNEQQHTLSVTADAMQEVAPDKVEITLSVISRGSDPSVLQEENDAKLRAVQSRIVSLGVPESNIKTTGYSLDKVQEYNKTSGGYEDRGYELRNTLRVVSYDVSLAGSIAKEAVQNGANDVSGISFMLSDAKQKEVYGQLLSQAASQAKAKAASMASAAGVQLTGLSQMSEGYTYTEPMANSAYRVSADSLAGGVPSPEVSISAGLLRVRASVSASYNVAG